MKKEKHLQLEDYYDGCDEVNSEELKNFKNIINCDELQYEKSFYCDKVDKSFTCLIYYCQFEPPAIIYHQTDSHEILIYLVRSRITKTNDITRPEIIEIYHFTHIFEFHEFSEEETLHFREALNFLLNESIESLLDSDFEYRIVN